jgi:hypothetical protein
VLVSSRGQSLVLTNFVNFVGTSSMVLSTILQTPELSVLLSALGLGQNANKGLET